MFKSIKINPASRIPKYRQIADGLTGLIESGALQVGDRLPSIDVVSRNTGIAKETVVQAYKHLRSNGIILSSKSRGFYVQTNITGKQWRVLVLFNVMSPSKEIIYKNIMDVLGDKAHVELFFHNYNFEMYENIVRSKADQFHYFIVMPHPDAGADGALQVLPPEKLIVLDTPLQHPVEGASSVVQHFREDVYNVLSSEKERLSKYKRIILLAEDEKNMSAEIFKGIKAFGRHARLPVSIAPKVSEAMLRKGTLFITLTDELLIDCIESLQEAGLRLGRDIGIISYNESPLKRILSGGIATLTSDFAAMGKTAASCILDKQVRVVRNPFSLIIRKSL